MTTDAQFLANIDAIQADGALTVDQKRTQTATQRSIAWIERLPAAPFTVAASGYSVLVTAVVAVASGVAIWCEITKLADNSLVRLSMPLVFLNPALLVTDALGTISRNGKTYRLDPATIFTQSAVSVAVKAG